VKSGTNVLIKATGEPGLVKATHYHYLDAKNYLNKILVKLSNGEMVTFSPEEIEEVK
jgi:hypothetical protein